MRLTLQITRSIPPALMEWVLALDHAAYPPEDQLTRSLAEMVYPFVGDSLVLLKNDGAPIGFVSAYAVRPDLAALALAERRPIFDVTRPEHLNPDGPADGYLSNLLLLPEYRGQGLRRCLFEGLALWLDRYPDLRILHADAVTDAGQRSLVTLGMVPSPVLPGLWSGPYAAVRKALEAALAKPGPAACIQNTDEVQGRP